MSLNSKNFGLAGGILVSLTLFGVVWHAVLTDMGYEFLRVWEDMHLWYEYVSISSPIGSFVALIDGFVHGFVYFYIFSWLYNWLERKKT